MLTQFEKWTPAERQVMRMRLPKTFARVHSAYLSERLARKRLEAMRREKIERARRKFEMDTARISRRLTCGDIVEIVSEISQVPATAIYSARRNRAVVDARQAAMFLCWVHTSNSMPQIGRAMGRDYSTVCHAVSKIKGVKTGKHQSINNIIAMAEKVIKARVEG